MERNGAVAAAVSFIPAAGEQSKVDVSGSFRWNWVRFFLPRSISATGATDGSSGGSFAPTRSSGGWRRGGRKFKVKETTTQRKRTNVKKRVFFSSFATQHVVSRACLGNYSNVSMKKTFLHHRARVGHSGAQCNGSSGFISFQRMENSRK